MRNTYQIHADGVTSTPMDRGDVDSMLRDGRISEATLVSVNGQPFRPLGQISPAWRQAERAKPAGIVMPEAPLRHVCGRILGLLVALGAPLIYVLQFAVREHYLTGLETIGLALAGTALYQLTFLEQPPPDALDRRGGDHGS